VTFSHRRISRALKLTGKSPVVALLGIVLLPLLHFAVKAKFLKSRPTAIWLAGKTGAEYRRPAGTEPQDIKRAADYARTLHLGVRLWRLDANSCIARSIMLWVICVRQSIPAKVIVGAPTGSSRDFHAWVEVHDTPVNDSLDVRNRYGAFDSAYLEFPLTLAGADS